MHCETIENSPACFPALTQRIMDDISFWIVAWYTSLHSGSPAGFRVWSSVLNQNFGMSLQPLDDLQSVAWNYK